MDKLSAAVIKKHLILYNKMVKDQTYFQVAKMKADKVREIFKRDFREIKSGKDGKVFYAPKNYTIDLDTDDKYVEELKKLAVKKPKVKAEAKTEKNKPKSKKPKFMILREELAKLLKQVKTSYEKNKPKLDKMTPLKYKNTIKRQNNKFLDDVKDIYNSLGYVVDLERIKENAKKFYKIVPEEKPKAKKVKS
jgi:hypothetical protein